MRVTTLVVCLGSSAFAQELVASDLVKVKPAEGLPAVGPFTPTWCDEVDSKEPRALARAADGKYLWDSFPQAAKFTCAAAEGALAKEQLGYYMQRWVNDTGATKEQVAEFIALRVDDEKWDAQVKATCDEKVPEADAEAGPREKRLRKMEREVLGCATRSTPVHLQGPVRWDAEDTWAFDRSPELASQITGLYRAATCLPADANAITMSELTHWAQCRKDLEQLDEAKLLAELKAAGHNDYARIIAQQALANARLYARITNAKFEAAVAKDPDVKSVLVDAPAKAWDGWVSAATTNKQAVDAARAFEDLVNGPRLSAAKGCLPKVSQHLKLAHAKRPAATPDDVAASVNSGIGPVLLDHLIRCLEVEGKQLPAYALSRFVEWGMPGRGPRTAVQVAMADVTAKLLADRPKFAITADMVRVDGWAPQGGTVGRGHRKLPSAQYAGEVKSVKKEGDRLMVTFKTVKWKEKERECTQTNRILQWRPDGTPLYMENCRYTGRIVEQSSTADPFFTTTLFGAELKPGAFVTYNSGTERVGNVFEGVPVAVWSSKEKTTLLAFMGIEAK